MKTISIWLVGISGILVLFAALCAYFVFATGFVLSQIWTWHFVPLGLPAVRWQFFAILPTALYLLRKPQLPESTGKLTRDDAGRIIGLALAPWFCLLVAWVLK